MVRRLGNPSSSSSPPLLVVACACLLLLDATHAVNPLRTPLEVMTSARAGEREDTSRGRGGRDETVPFMDVPRANLNMTRGVDFDLQRKGSGVSFHAVKLRQLRVSGVDTTTPTFVRFSFVTFLIS